MNKGSIGVFDSGYGGLTVLKELIKDFPDYDFLYLGDNARTPYGTRSFDVVYEYTLQAVKFLFERGCPLVIIACNTASAKALRNIQQLDLPHLAPDKRVLGVIRPSVEKVAEITQNGHVGVLGTLGTVASESYPIELKKWSNGKVISTVQEACPMWVPIVENNEIGSEGAAYFVQKNINNILAKDPDLDTLILGCTHYPILKKMILQYIPNGIQLLEQGKIVSEKLLDYLKRHPEIDKQLGRLGDIHYLTTEAVSSFDSKASIFLGKEVQSEHVHF